VAKSDKNDYIDWDAGREGYVQVSNRYIPVVPVKNSVPKVPGQSGLLSIRTEERFGSLVAAGGTIWAVYVATQDWANLWDNLWRLQIAPPGPLEVCALGILTWLHAKWRRSMKS
jgi:hypothetical protein